VKARDAIANGMTFAQMDRLITARGIEQAAPNPPKPWSKVISSANAIGQARRGDAQIDQTASSASPAPTCSLDFGDLVVVGRTVNADGENMEFPIIYRKLLTDRAHEAQAVLEEDVPLMLTAAVRAIRELKIPVRWKKHLATPIDGKPRISEEDA